MRFLQAQTLSSIAELVQCEFIGDPNFPILGINEIHRVEEGDIVFVDHPKYYDKALNSNASVVLINKKVDCPEGKALLISDHPFDDFNRITKQFRPFKAFDNLIGANCDIHPSAMISPTATIGNNVIIGANVVVYPGAVIGDYCQLDENVIVGSNSVIGHYAFYYKKKDDIYNRMHSCGSVHLHKNVEIGALCTIDAGVTAITIIGAGTKIDNQVHIGHDSVVGENCLFAANVGIAGCVRIEDRVTLWGQVGCTSDVTIGEGATVLAQSGISKSLPGNKTYFGSPCIDVRAKFREMAAIKKLPELLERL